MKFTFQTVLVLAATSSVSSASKLKRQTGTSAERALRLQGGKGGKGGKGGQGGNNGSFLSVNAICSIYENQETTCTEEFLLVGGVCPTQDEVCDPSFTPEAWCAAENTLCGTDPICTDYLTTCCEVQCCEKPEAVADNACEIISLIPQDDTCAFNFDKELCPCGDVFNATVPEPFCEHLVGGYGGSKGGGKGKSSGGKGKGKSSSYSMKMMDEEVCLDTCQAYVESCCGEAPVELCDDESQITDFSLGFVETSRDEPPPELSGSHELRRSAFASAVVGLCAI